MFVYHEGVGPMLTFEINSQSSIKVSRQVVINIFKVKF